MSFTTTFSFFLIFASIFSQNYAAFFKKIDKPESEKFSDYYSRMRKNDVYRGILLSKPLDKQNVLCGDILSSQYFKQQNIVLADEDLLESKVDSSFARSDETPDKIVIKKMISEDKVIAEEEIFLICHGMKDGVSLNTHPYYISYAFQASVFHISEKSKQHEEVEVEQYYDGLTAPKDLFLNLSAVEKAYITVRQSIDALRQESPQYVEMVEARDDIQALSDDERVVLCGSVLSTFDFRSQKLILDLEWFESSEKKEILKNQPLRIWHEDYPNYKLSSDNALCRAYDTILEKKKDFHYTRSYNNRNSVFFIDERETNVDHETALDLDSYFENIPVLMNAKKISGANRV